MGNDDEVIETSVRSRPVRLILAWGQVTATGAGGFPPLPPSWVVEVGGTRYAGFPADPGDVDEASVQGRLDRWADAHPLVFRAVAP